MADTTSGQARAAGETAEARAYGLTPGDLGDWAPFSPVEVYWARKHQLTPVKARRWASEGLRVSDAVRAAALGMTPEEVRPWADAGFAPGDAVEAKETGVPLETAVAWREAGFILPDAALLIRDGWTLAAAVRARYAGIAEEDRPRGWNSSGGSRVLPPAGALVSPGPNHCLHGIPSGWSHDAPFAVRRPAYRPPHALASTRSRGRCHVRARSLERLRPPLSSI